MALKCRLASESPRGLIKTDCWAQLQGFWFSALGRDKLCVSKKFKDDMDNVGPRHTRWQPLIQTTRHHLPIQRWWFQNHPLWEECFSNWLIFSVDHEFNAWSSSEGWGCSLCQEHLDTPVQCTWTGLCLTQQTPSTDHMLGCQGNVSSWYKFLNMTPLYVSHLRELTHWPCW